ncbi:Cu(I)-responsive transcriptional regulator [Aquabacterium sp.]|jgi:Cu(I)-responsive transcriptional regulator|uniref:Cu(I)-responsive transcriptional regulator n=1 Tax=Aquabacterium TaxID=92793 RepID=UPI001D798FB9|nr:Cu(I)-responsive transcriptional regulator [Aquabacterium sp.]MBT9609007.1 Cu(I)-responsive transcriptional regulator [Aquabacterium sp.]
MSEPLRHIGEAARLTGVSPKMVRHYEGLGLLPPAPRTDSGYRLYDEAALHTLRFIRRARDLGFGMADIAQLLDLWRNRRRASASVKKLATAHVAALQQRIDELEAMKRTLSRLAAECQGNARAPCPILDDLGQGPPPCVGHASGSPPD